MELPCMGMPAKPPSLQQCDAQDEKGVWARVLGLILSGKDFQANTIVRAKVLRWSVPTLLKNGHPA